MITVLCPTRNRPEQCRRMMASVIDTSTSAEIFLSVAEDDPAIENYRMFRTQKRTTIFYVPDYPTVHKWNMLADAAMQMPDVNLFMLGADDIIFETQGWDKVIEEHYNALENKIHVYAMQDSRDLAGTPHPIVTREWIEAMGYFLPPIFCHWNVDTWTAGIAKSNNCFTHLTNLSLVHLKPSDYGQADDTHNRIRNCGWRERDAYVAQTCQHYLEFEKERLAKEIMKASLK